MSYETEAWPYLAARDIGARRTVSVRLVVIHDMEFPERPGAAEDVARYFQHPDKPSSAHICVDSDSIVQCVHDSFVAFAAPGANNDGIQIELAGYASQTRAQWLDKYSIALLAIAADATAQYCLKYALPPVHITDNELAHGIKGIIGHDQASRVYKRSDHSDPGPNFPWDRFIGMVESHYRERR